MPYLWWLLVLVSFMIMTLRLLWPSMTALMLQQFSFLNWPHKGPTIPTPEEIEPFTELLCMQYALQRPSNYSDSY